ncbi:MAG: Bug family tripartite tricarboxylate transporter substrate binding protein [Pararhodobacter sp.]
MRTFTKALVALPFLAMAATAQTDYPTQPITMVVGFSAGGGMDTLARLVAAESTEHLGQQMVVENRPGAGGTIAGGYAANARADGYTLFLGETATLVGPVVHGNVGYDPLESFFPVAQLTSAPLALVAHPDFPASDMQGFIDLVRENPGEYFYASPGVATIQHLAVEQLAMDAGLEMDVVHFQGGTPSVTAVVSGEVPLGIVSLNAAVAQAEGGNLIVLGVTSAERVPGFDDIPAFGEVVPGFDAAPRMFVFAPAGVDETVQTRLRGMMAAIMDDEAFREGLVTRGFVVEYLDGPELAEQLPGLVESWSATAETVLAND